jgi:hypothetical protein
MALSPLSFFLSRLPKAVVMLLCCNIRSVYFYPEQISWSWYFHVKCDMVEN